MVELTGLELCGVTCRLFSLLKNNAPTSDPMHGVVMMPGRIPNYYLVAFWRPCIPFRRHTICRFGFVGFAFQSMALAFGQLLVVSCHFLTLEEMDILLLLHGFQKCA